MNYSDPWKEEAASQIHTQALQTKDLHLRIGWVQSWWNQTVYFAYSHADWLAQHWNKSLWCGKTLLPKTETPRVHTNISTDTKWSKAFSSHAKHTL